MDKWEEMMQMMMKMPDEEKMKKMEMLSSMCICKNCPSYLGTGETGALFCSKGKSSKITDEKGCTCAGCPVRSQQGLTKEYYCIKGNEAQQRGVGM